MTSESKQTSAYITTKQGNEKIQKNRCNDRHLLLGVTGTIASGKTTVADMLAAHGAYTIDFDQISRLVVEPGKQAYHQIIDYFGKHVVQPDMTLDRQKLSDIVFSDPEKRKKIESYIHPQIQLHYIAMVDKITEQDPGAIIQVIVPLMIELNMQYLFHKVLVVYAPQATLTKRLMKRNGISEAVALRMIQTQISIDEKKKHADFIIDNGKNRASTQKQVDALWEKLLVIQTTVR